MNSGRSVLICLAISLSANAQTLTNASLTGKYFVRHVEFSTDTANTVTDARSIEGAITFSGSGSYGFVGQQVIGTAAAGSYTVSGTYSVSPAGLVTISNPQKPALTINARYAAEAVIGASTEATDNTFDLFVAIPSAGGQSNTVLTGSFYATDFELTGGLTSQVRDAFVNLSLDGAGNITSGTATGHASNVSAGGISVQTTTGGTYSVPAGTLTLPGFTLLGSAQRALAVSNSGNVFIAATPGAHDILIGVKAGGTTLTPGFWMSGLRVDSSGNSADFAGSGETINGVRITAAQRWHETGASLNVTASDNFTIASDGSGSYGPSKIGIGNGGNLMVSASLSAVLDPTGYQIGFAIANPVLSGTSVFIHPRGVVNAASGAPGVDAVSPGEFIAIYGSGLAAATASSLPPYPPSVGGVTVLIGGIQAAIYFVSAGQIDCLVPYGVTGATVDVTVTNNGTKSNTVTVPLAKTSPGIFSLDTSGTGDGATEHLDGSVVNAASPATKGEVVTAYMTGLGAVVSPVADGHGATGADAAVAGLVVYVNGVAIPASGVLYAGLTPGVPGLYQISFRVPATLTVSGELPLAILTNDAYHDQVNIAVK